MSLWGAHRSSTSNITPACFFMDSENSYERLCHVLAHRSSINKLHRLVSLWTPKTVRSVCAVVRSSINNITLAEQTSNTTSAHYKVPHVYNSHCELHELQKASKHLAVYWRLIMSKFEIHTCFISFVISTTCKCCLIAPFNTHCR